MSYRDDLESALARAEAAEREVQATRIELDAALAGTPPPERLVDLESQLAAARVRLRLIPGALWTAVLLGIATLLMLLALVVTATRGSQAVRDTQLVADRCEDRSDRLEQRVLACYHREAVQHAAAAPAPGD